MSEKSLILKGYADYVRFLGCVWNRGGDRYLPFLPPSLFVDFLYFCCVTRSSLTASSVSSPHSSGTNSSLTTFILTFFLNQSWGFWQEVHTSARKIQGRLNDFNLLLATGAKRNPDGTLTAESEQLLDDISANSRLFHALYWASCARRFSVLRTPKGLERMASRGLMTSRQLKVLQGLDLPDNQRHNACLEWMMIRAWKGIDDGTLRKEPSFSQRLMDQMCQLRGTYAGVGDKLSVRMPLPYTVSSYPVAC